MSALSALARVYDRMAARGEVPAFGYSLERVGFLIELKADGTPAGRPIDLRESNGRKKIGRLLAVPRAAKRTSGIAPNFLWDKSAYVLGVTAREGSRTAMEHDAFVNRHRAWLSGIDDDGLKALLSFLDHWAPEQFIELGWPDEMKDQNVVFALERERLDNTMIHDRPAARDLWACVSATGEKIEGICLISGNRGPIARLHPTIKGVWGAQSSGASLVSFNLDAFTSYGHEQGDNASVSETMAFAYASALNRLLEPDSGRCMEIGGTTIVFWADSSNREEAVEAERLFANLFAPDRELAKSAIGSPHPRILLDLSLRVADSDLYRGLRFCVLGLAPNAARLSVRFYIEDDFGAIMRRYLGHLERMRVSPPPMDALSMGRLFIETAALRRRENIPASLVGEWIRAVLSDTPYPATLLSILLMRLRADHGVSAMRAGILRSVLVRNFNLQKEAPVSFDPANREAGYLLGRLFAVHEQIQKVALGSNLNATIKDTFYGSAAAQPRRIFYLLETNSIHYLSKIGRQNRSRRVSLEKILRSIMELMSPQDDPFPMNLPSKDQALFALGYYHQRNDFFVKPPRLGEHSE